MEGVKLIELDSDNISILIGTDLAPAFVHYEARNSQSLLSSRAEVAIWLVADGPDRTPIEICVGRLCLFR